MDDMLKRIGQADQVQAAMATIAGIVGAYYTQLMKSGVPDELATRLTEEFHTGMIQKYLGPGGTFSGPKPPQGKGK